MFVDRTLRYFFFFLIQADWSHRVVFQWCLINSQFSNLIEQVFNKMNSTFSHIHKWYWFSHKVVIQNISSKNNYLFKTTHFLNITTMPRQMGKEHKRYRNYRSCDNSKFIYLQSNKGTNLVFKIKCENFSVLIQNSKINPTHDAKVVKEGQAHSPENTCWNHFRFGKEAKKSTKPQNFNSRISHISTQHQGNNCSSSK